MILSLAFFSQKAFSQHLVDNYVNYGDYPSGTNGEMGLTEYTNTAPFARLGVANAFLSNVDIDLYHLFPTWPGWGGGAYNDKAVGAWFTGNMDNMVFFFYDSPSPYMGPPPADETDDYCRVTFKKSPPPGKAYVLEHFEQNYSDEYVAVYYHSKDGLNGKVSFIHYTSFSL